MSRVLAALGLLCLGACGQAGERPEAAGSVAEAPGEEPGGLHVEPSAGGVACSGVAIPAEPLPADLFALVDRSGSMNEATSTGVSKWYATKAAFRDFLQHAPSGTSVGLSLFPSFTGQGSCDPQAYVQEALPFGDVASTKEGALARLEAARPTGSTPTAPALAAAYELATAQAVANPQRSIVVVLASDGIPTSCAPTDAASLAALARAALEGEGHVRTLVVASSSLVGSDEGAFAAIAAAGGTGRPVAIDPHADFARQLGDALGAVARRQVACDLALPEPPERQRLDYDAVNVVLEGSARRTFPRVAGPEDCDAAGGWYYDVDPVQGAPSRLNMCKSSCDVLSNAGTSMLKVELGCKTLVRVR